jgi:hypothetical protein
VQKPEEGHRRPPPRRHRKRVEASVWERLLSARTPSMASTPRLAPAASVGAALLVRLDTLAEIDAGAARSPVQESGASRT